ncbi:MAG TPA: UDP-N-acetylmuramoyl-tripeptide--D-alanyl-D-alanine ligase [Chloroflexota bacterium]|nr:UDP-N-acetylmuramoyl-tripeptide--D-alanyl-D-alanine ligase [Chloroflexota bacterium]
MTAAEKTFSLGDLLAWRRDGDAARRVGPDKRIHVFSTVTHSSLLNGSPPMEPGGLFVAHKARRDGHDFVVDAFRNGARTALVSRIPPGVDEERLVVVEDTLDALQRCATWWRRQHRARVIALTGSVGKTTTKDLLTNILSRREPVLSTRGNFNNEFGLPFMLLELTDAYAHAVLEIGISAVGEMETFARIAAPDVGIVTRVAPAHLEFFGDVDTVEREKGRLVEALPRAGVAVLNADDPRVARMRGRTSARVVTYGTDPSADVRARDVELLGFDGVRFALERAGDRCVLTLPMIGRHFVTCALAAAAAAFEEGTSWEDVVAGLEQPLASPRLAPIPLPNGVTILDDTYNASPEATKAALDVLAACAGRRIAVLGDMFEMGEAGPATHRDVGAYVPGHADELLAVGELGRHIADAAREAGLAARSVEWAATTESAAALLEPRLRAGDFVLVKGSRGMHMDQIVAALAGERAPSGHH